MDLLDEDGNPKDLSIAGMPHGYVTLWLIVSWAVIIGLLVLGHGRYWPIGPFVGITAAWIGVRIDMVLALKAYREKKAAEAALATAREKAREEGIQEGRLAGREEGRLAGREEGREEGRLAGRQEAWEEFKRKYDITE